MTCFIDTQEVEYCETLVIWEIPVEWEIPMRGGIQMDWEKIKLGVWSAIGGAIVLAIVGFAWGGWVTGGTSQKRAEEMADNAVASRLAPICVEQFNQDPEKAQKLDTMKKEDSWKRGDYVQKQGWATMPGEKKPDEMVAERCADTLMKFASN
ncbi:MAG: hypothetical protein ACE5IM_02260 [Nitrospinota bacterium]